MSDKCICGQDGLLVAKQTPSFAVVPLFRPFECVTPFLLDAEVCNVGDEKPFDVAVGHIALHGGQLPYFRQQRVGQAVDECAAFL